MSIATKRNLTKKSVIDHSRLYLAERTLLIALTIAIPLHLFSRDDTVSASQAGMNPPAVEASVPIFDAAIVQDLKEKHAFPFSSIDAAKNALRRRF
ncbi:MAG: hypothetical protein AB8F65_09960 [Woeseiaceae bacterium]